MTMRGQAATSDLRVALQRTAELLVRDPRLAEQQAREVLRVYPGEMHALHLLAAARRRAGDPDSALAMLEPVVARNPDFAQARQELGLTLLDLGRTREAEADLEAATTLDPRLPVAWKLLGELRLARGDDAGSQDAYRQFINLTAGHEDLVKVARLLLAGRLGLAEDQCREFLKAHPDNVSAIRMLAEIGIKLERYRDAETLLDRCLEMAPDFHLARSNYATVLLKTLRYESALAQIEQVLAAEPTHPSHLLLKASILVQIGRTEAAIEIYNRVLATSPGQARTHLSLGHALKTVGRQAEAVAAYREAIRRRPGLGEAYWSLANLKTFRFDDADLDAMDDQIGLEQADKEDSFHLHFALGKAREDRGAYDNAFEHYARGNALRRQTVRWDAEEHHRNTCRLRDFFTREFLAERAGQGCPSAEPIFVVGLPRSGSTLLEQILASHSQVEGTMELPDIISIARRLSGKKSREQESRYPGILAELSPGQLAELGEEYLARTRVHRSRAAHFIDKMPNNFMHVGLIHLILPNARIIDARRHPLACCFSGFKQLFASGQNFSYSLEEIGRYYRDYVDLMGHWDAVQPGRVLRVEYEAVVADTEAEVRRLLAYCQLDFEPACLKFHETERAVRTASSEQVRQPIYAAAVDQWRHFAGHLAPLAAALGPVLGAPEDEKFSTEAKK
jgi:tetratricopeptide (TPR) repeat protein